jgi:endonuclease/exonuclease/phosphatase family metal-dependent hydrolase
MTIKVGTFNVRNLFSNYNFKAKIADVIKIDGGVLKAKVDYITTFTSDVYKFRTYMGSRVQGKNKEDTQKVADRVNYMDVDVLALQEVEDLDTLFLFEQQYLRENDKNYKYRVLVEGNDFRFIDVAILSKLPVGGVTSWKHAVHPDDPGKTVFGRDLLEVDILNANRTKTLFKIFNNHLKSHWVDWRKERAAGKRDNDARRTRQAEMITKIVKARTRPNSAFIITGDMNDPPDSTCLSSFVDDPELDLTNALADPEETRPAPDDRHPPTSKSWTHRYKPSRKPAKYELYDQIWLSPKLASKQIGAWINRRKWHKGDGSDHDPAWIELDI